MINNELVNTTASRVCPTETTKNRNYAFAKTTTLLAGMTMVAEAGMSCSGGPSAFTPPSLPATCGFTSTPLALQLS